MSDQRDPSEPPPLVVGTTPAPTDDRRDALRRLVRTFRAALTAEARLESARLASARLLPVLTELRHVLPSDRSRSPVVALSVPVDGEIDITSTAAHLRTDGWTVALPAVLNERDMEFREWPANGELVRGRFRVLEPADGPALEPDVVVVPCVAVDDSGNRLGFGKGFYDRALGGDRRPAAVGVVFDEQVVAAVPAKPWDVPLDLVVTPTQVIRPDR